MKSFDEYFPSEDIDYDLEIVLRDILAELEANSRNIKQLDTCLSAELATINARLAKLEQANQNPMSIDQEIAYLYAEISALDVLISQTPPEDVIDLGSLESRKKQVQEEIVVLEEARKP